MRPGEAAIQLTKVWRSLCGDDSPFPVNCKLLAEGLKIKVHGEEIDDRFEAMLGIKGTTRIIVYNEKIREKGRKNFCIAHELGHHSCHSKRKEFRCSIDDLNDMAPHPQNIEQEANLFAANLLMPARDFRKQIDGREPTLSSLGLLAEERYQTSLTATCRRFIDLSPTSFIGMAFVRDGKVIQWDQSENMRYTGFGFCRGHQLPITVHHNPDWEDVDSNVWLNKKNAPRWSLQQSSIFMPYYKKTLVLIKAARTEDSDYWRKSEEPNPTPPRIPSFT